MEISGNNNTLKHVFSPTHFLLSKFIMSYFGVNNRHIARSFNIIKKNKFISKTIYNYTNKEYDGKLLTEVSQSVLGMYRGILSNDRYNLSPQVSTIISKIENIPNSYSIDQKRSYCTFNNHNLMASSARETRRLYSTLINDSNTKIQPLLRGGKQGEGLVDNLSTSVPDNSNITNPIGGFRNDLFLELYNYINNTKISQHEKQTQIEEFLFDQ